MEEKIKELEKENHELRERLEMFIPRRRVRRVYKMLGDIIEENTDTTFYVSILKDFINKIEKEGKAEAGQAVKTAIEHLLSVRER